VTVTVGARSLSLLHFRRHSDRTQPAEVRIEQHRIVDEAYRIASSVMVTAFPPQACCEKQYCTRRLRSSNLSLQSGCDVRYAP